MDKILNSPFSTLRQWMSIAPDSYWETHYQFGKSTVPHASGLGTSTVESLIVNTVVPLRFGYSRFVGDMNLQEEAMALLERVCYEDNKTTRVFDDSVFPRMTAYDSQAQIELMGRYCSQKSCLRCAIGEAVVREIRARPPNA